MISETEQKRHKVDLEFLKSTLESADIPTTFFEASAENPVSYLTGNMPASYSGPPAAFQLLFIPGENLLEDISLLQIYTYSQETLREINSENYNFVRHTNHGSLLGFFGIENEEKRIFHRYVYSIPRFKVPDEAVFLEVLGLCFGNFGRISDLILNISNGKTSMEDAINILNG